MVACGYGPLMGVRWQEREWMAEQVTYLMARKQKQEEEAEAHSRAFPY